MNVLIKLSKGTTDRISRTKNITKVVLYISLLLCRSIAKVTGEHQDDWDDLIDPVLFSIRTAVQESTHYTPFFLMYGREARFPLEVEVSEGVSSETQLADVQSAVSRLQEVREKIFPNASKNISASQSKQREQYRRRKGLDNKVTIKEGDLVLHLNMLKRTKKVISKKTHGQVLYMNKNTVLPLNLPIHITYFIKGILIILMTRRFNLVFTDFAFAIQNLLEQRLHATLYPITFLYVMRISPDF